MQNQENNTKNINLEFEENNSIPDPDSWKLSVEEFPFSGCLVNVNNGN